MIIDVSSAADRPRVTVVGLGPAGPDLCTVATLEAIADHRHRLVRTIRHPAVTVLGDHVLALDHHYESADSFAEVYAGVVDEVVMAAEAHARVLYAVPGSPMVAERTVELLLADDRVEVSLVPALSFVDLAWVRLGLDPLVDGVRIVDAYRFSVEASGERGPLLVAQVDTPAVLSDVVASVKDPPGEPVTVLQRLGTNDERIMSVAWDDLPAVIDPDHLTSLFVPQLVAPIAIEMQRFVELVGKLRYECPWDAEQTHTTLRPHLLEEAHELLEALDGYDEATGEGSKALEEELGDLLFQVVFHARIAADDGRFDLADVARGIHDKLRHRHPHVFPRVPDGDRVPDLGQVDGSDDVLANWDRIKQIEKGRESVLDGIPPTLPALAAAQKVLRRAAGIQVEPDPAMGPPTGLVELMVDDQGLGDLLLAVVGAARGVGLDAEEALRDAVSRFSTTVRAVEQNRLFGEGAHS
ncbi:MAG: MazG nucleotide pyrophosphohydrolase domain-containing protein [Acidimicrobiales bacterium]|nr:MazG nucleotide pyrophosphohydrolase domain-containing protein [Acidimicrobiales bacterium]